MSITKMLIICDGAKANGLKLVGEPFIGFKFCDGDQDVREEANELLCSLFTEDLSIYELSERTKFLESIKDEPYSYARWTSS